MSQQEKPVWEFQKKEDSEEPEDTRTFLEKLEDAIPEFLRQNYILYLQVTGMVVVGIAILLVVPGGETDPLPSPPGEEVRTLTESDMENWMDITRNLSRLLGENPEVSVSSSRLLGFYNEKQENPSLAELARQATEGHEEVSFETYLEITHAIARQSPHREQTRVEEGDQNQQLVREHREEVMDLWEDLRG